MTEQHITASSYALFAGNGKRSQYTVSSFAFATSSGTQWAAHSWCGYQGAPSVLTTIYAARGVLQQTGSMETARISPSDQSTASPKEGAFSNLPSQVIRINQSGQHLTVWIFLGGIQFAWLSDRLPTKKSRNLGECPIL
ncbi:uncharacterized protein BO96DRAFT_436295 [Aspergillus niger CBS 101883]|uniref:Uncharacterized protein n=2 Tax=Aspergillus niger TaxID=5061 RepID=A2R503_ASPNC|nr:uncharacterized protein BO96DRAFT_436295 [Aspergillus niger CBS 101883]XP_059602467.1 hypothetical protein An15g02220 [Aspergillus niger]PYH54241.1 hypothetical protein BO96DRAFT_436295 [Aspergillus niger CBS 101883]CAK42325.1 hypothetical protein An15g02220 [Aspergillus niger]